MTGFAGSSVGSNGVMRSRTVEDDVRAFCEAGWAVFPLVPGGKFPAVEGGFKTASAHVLDALALFVHPDMNVGIATGASGLVVLDVDGLDGEASLVALLKDRVMPQTFTVRTRRGRHFYFAAPSSEVRCSAGVLGKGLDIRANGGYVVAPGSWVAADKKGPSAYYVIVDGSPVATLPNWLATLLTMRRMQSRDLTADQQRGVLFYVSNTPRQRAIVRNLLSVISADCEYDRWRAVVWSLLRTGWVDAISLARDWSMSAPHRYEERAFDRLVADFNPRRFMGSPMTCLVKLAEGMA